MKIDKQLKTEFSVIDGTVIHTLLETLEFKSKNGAVFVVPKGYKTNGASVPRALWSFLNPFGVAFPAAILHDYLVRENEKTLNSAIDYDHKKLRWSQATVYFEEALRDITQTPPWKIPVVCKSVNLNGKINHKGNY